MQTVPFALAALLLLPAALLAQPETLGGPPDATAPLRHGGPPWMGSRGDRGPQPHGEPPFPDRLETLADYLDLTDAQRLELESLVEEHRARRMDRLETLHDLHGQLRDLLDTASPDPIRVGELTIALDAEKEALAAARRGEIDEIESLLTPDQRERFEALETARRLEPRPPHGFQGHQRGPRGGERRPEQG